MKNDKVIDFLTQLPTDFSAFKNILATHSFNNIVETTQLTNDQMPEFHWHCKCSKCTLLALAQALSRFEKSFTALSIGHCGSLPQIT